ncbi:MAG TPA: hypothetical protein VGG75_24310 [Trebonia sp.]
MSATNPTDNYSSWPWETVLGSVLDIGVPDRSAITAQSWLTIENQGSPTPGSHLIWSAGWDAAKNAAKGTSQSSIEVYLNPALYAGGGAWDLFVNAPSQALNTSGAGLPLVPGTFSDAGRAVATAISTVNSVNQQFASLYHSVATETTSLNGSVAGLLQELLSGLQQVTLQFYDQMTSPVSYSDTIDTAGYSASTFLSDLRSAYTTWTGYGAYSPLGAIVQVLQQISGPDGSGAVVIPDPRNTPYGDLTTAPAWTAVESQAKNTWAGLLTGESGQFAGLDTLGRTALSKLVGQYAATAGALKPVLGPGLPQYQPGSDGGGKHNNPTPSGLTNGTVFIPRPGGNPPGTPPPGTQPPGAPPPATQGPFVSTATAPPGGGGPGGTFGGGGRFPPGAGAHLALTGTGGPAGVGGTGTGATGAGLTGTGSGGQPGPGPLLPTASRLSFGAANFAVLPGTTQTGGGPAADATADPDENDLLADDSTLLATTNGAVNGPIGASSENTPRTRSLATDTNSDDSTNGTSAQAKSGGFSGTIGSRARSTPAPASQTPTTETRISGTQTLATQSKAALGPAGSATGAVSEARMAPVAGASVGGGTHGALLQQSAVPSVRVNTPGIMSSPVNTQQVPSAQPAVTASPAAGAGDLTGGAGALPTHGLAATSPAAPSSGAAPSSLANPAGPAGTTGAANAVGPEGMAETERFGMMPPMGGIGSGGYLSAGALDHGRLAYLPQDQEAWGTSPGHSAPPAIGAAYHPGDSEPEYTGLPLITGIGASVRPDDDDARERIENYGTSASDWGNR